MRVVERDNSGKVIRNLVAKTGRNIESQLYVRTDYIRTKPYGPCRDVISLKL